MRGERRGEMQRREGGGAGRLNFPLFPTLAIAAMHQRGN